MDNNFLEPHNSLSKVMFLYPKFRYPIRKTSEKEQGVKVRSGLIDVKPLQCSYSNGATWKKIDQSQR